METGDNEFSSWACRMSVLSLVEGCMQVPTLVNVKISWWPHIKILVEPVSTGWSRIVVAKRLPCFADNFYDFDTECMFLVDREISSALISFTHVVIHS